MALPEPLYYSLSEAIDIINKKEQTELNEDYLLQMGRFSKIEICTHLEVEENKAVVIFYIPGKKHFTNDIIEKFLKRIYTDTGTLSCIDFSVCEIGDEYSKPIIANVRYANTLVAIPNYDIKIGSYRELDLNSIDCRAFSSPKTLGRLYSHYIPNDNGAKVYFFMKESYIVPIKSLVITSEELNNFLRCNDRTPNILNNSLELGKLHKKESPKTINAQARFIKALLYHYYGESIANNPRPYIEKNDGEIRKDFEMKGLSKELPCYATVKKWIDGIELDIDV